MRVGPEIYDEVKGSQKLDELGSERGFAVERAPSRLVLGMHRVEQPAREGELGRRGVADQLEAGLGPATAQRGERRQRDDEVAERAASKDEDFSHPSERRRPARRNA